MLIVAGITTIGTVGYGVDTAVSKPNVCIIGDERDTDKTNEIFISKRGAVYFGANKRGGTWKLVTAPMSFAEAYEGAYLSADSHVYSKGEQG